MEKITKEQFDNLEFEKRGNIPGGINQTILNLEVNEALIIKKKEWHLKTSPIMRIQSDCHNKKCFLFKNKIRVKCGTLADGSGWSILRIK